MCVYQMIFFLFLAPQGGYNPEGPIIIPFLTLRGKANFY